MYCPKCNHYSTDNYCPKCGTKLELKKSLIDKLKSDLNEKLNVHIQYNNTGYSMPTHMDINGVSYRFGNCITLDKLTIRKLISEQHKDDDVTYRRYPENVFTITEAK